MTKLQQVREALETVLCDPDGNVCCAGSEGDIKVLTEAFAALRELEAEQHYEAIVWQGLRADLQSANAQIATLKAARSKT